MFNTLCASEGLRNAFPVLSENQKCFSKVVGGPSDDRESHKTFPIFPSLTRLLFFLPCGVWVGNPSMCGTQGNQSFATSLAMPLNICLLSSVKAGEYGLALLDFPVRKNLLECSMVADPWDYPVGSVPVNVS